eukprot:TRINITY_DN1270_c0_g1_i1.p1 TRINITY_DN1270_c0_g1~~TRINITY_DN1270_c0_g1_i1.p1  ORF type:complete len:1015 (+),score=321.52 TRINITY_DN1270_c0_g1_i1:281-3325(+)
MCDDLGTKYSGVYYFNKEKNEIGETLKILSYNASIEIVDTYSLIEIEQIFTNEKDNQELIAIIPVEEIGSKIFSLTIEVDGEIIKNPKPIDNQPTNLSLTTKAFSEIVSKQPFYCKMPSGKSITVKIEYVAKLEWIEERFSFLLPSSAWGKFETKLSKPSFKERLSKKLTKPKTDLSVKFKVNIDIEMSSEILSVEASLPGFKSKKENKKANLQYLGETFPDLSIYVYFKVKEPRTTRIWSSPVSEEIKISEVDNVSVLMYSVLPIFETKGDCEVLFLVDNSISMKENGFSKITKKVLEIAHKNLPNDCPFNIATFGDEPMWLFPKSEPKNKKSSKTVTKYLSSLLFNSKTTILSQILEYVFDPSQLPPYFIDKQTKYTRQVVIITDGYISDPLQLSEIKSICSEQRIFVCGMGPSSITFSSEMTCVSNGSSITILNTDNEKDLTSKVTHMTTQISFPAPPLKMLDIKQCGNTETILDTSPLPSICSGEFFSFFQVVQNSSFDKFNGEIMVKTGESLFKFDLSKKSENQNETVKKIASFVLMDEMDRGFSVRADRKKRRLKFAENYRMECGKLFSNVKSDEQILNEKKRLIIESNGSGSSHSIGSTSKEGGFLERMSRDNGTGLSKVNTFPQPRQPPNRMERLKKHDNILKQVNQINNPSSKSFEKVNKIDMEGIFLFNVLCVLRDTFGVSLPFSRETASFVFSQSDVLAKQAKIFFSTATFVPVSQLESMSSEKITKSYPEVKEKLEQEKKVSAAFSLVSYHLDKGGRDKMEDSLVFLPHFYNVVGLGDKRPCDYIAIFDGHSGFQAADFCQQQLHIELKSNLLAEKGMKESFEKSYISTNERYNTLANENNIISGTTAVTALVDKDKLYIANVGDSEAFLFEDDQIVNLTVAHNPSLKSEEERLRNEGAKLILRGNAFRVDGTLAVSRSIGDPKYEPYVNANPHFYEHTITPKTKFVVLASDGLWDVYNFKEVADIVNQCAVEDRAGLSKVLVDGAIKKGSTDNISAIVAFF